MKETNQLSTSHIQQVQIPIICTRTISCLQVSSDFYIPSGAEFQYELTDILFDKIGFILDLTWRIMGVGVGHFSLYFL